MTTTLTQIDPPPGLGGGSMVPHLGGLSALRGLVRSVEEWQRHLADAGLTLADLARALEPGPVVFAFDHGGRHWHAVEWLAVRPEAGYPVVSADGCTERHERGRLRTPPGVPARAASPYTVVSPWPVVSPQVRAGATQPRSQHAQPRSAPRHNHGG